jgi:hypothetical protein
VNVIAVLPLAPAQPDATLAANTKELDQSLLLSLQRNTSLEVVNLSHPDQTAKALTPLQHSAVSLREQASTLGRALHV